MMNLEALVNNQIEQLDAEKDAKQSAAEQARAKRFTALRNRVACILNLWGYAADFTGATDEYIDKDDLCYVSMILSNSEFYFEEVKVFIPNEGNRTGAGVRIVVRAGDNGTASATVALTGETIYKCKFCDDYHDLTDQVFTGVDFANVVREALINGGA